MEKRHPLDILGGPLFVPNEEQQWFNRYLNYPPNALRDELTRRANVGSRWAACTLALMYLKGDMGGSRDIEGALQVTEGVSREEYSYGEYIRAWCFALKGDHVRAIELMKSAAIRGFPPAALDLAGFVAAGIGVQEPNPVVALKLLRHARASRHVLWLSRWCSISLTGRAGVLRKGLALLIVLPVQIFCGLRAWRDPMAMEVFAFDPSSTQHVFR